MADTPEVFNETQSAALDEIHGAVGGDGMYATAFRDPASVVSGPHEQGSAVGFSADAQQAMSFFAGRQAAEQAAINGGRNGVVHSGYVNYGDI